MLFSRLDNLSTTFLWGLILTQKDIYNGITLKLSSFDLGKNISSIFIIFKRRRLSMQEEWSLIYFHRNCMKIKELDGNSVEKISHILKISSFLRITKPSPMISKVNFSNFPSLSRHSSKTIAWKSHIVLLIHTLDWLNSSQTWLLSAVIEASSQKIIFAWVWEG